MVRCTVDGIPVEVDDGTSTLDAARQAGISIPTLCHHEDLETIGSCGMCVVEIEGERAPKRSCLTPVRDGMIVRTSTPRLRRTRRTLLELVLAAHPHDCLHCIKHGKCELQDLAEKLEVRSLRYDAHTRGLPVDTTSASIVRDMNKCIGCGRCVQICNDVQTASAIHFQGRGSETIVAPAGDGMGAGVCTNCGQCVVYCPVGALYDILFTRDNVEAVRNRGQSLLAQRLVDAAETYDRLKPRLDRASELASADPHELHQLVKTTLLCQLSERPYFNTEPLSARVKASFLLHLNQSDIRSNHPRLGLSKVKGLFTKIDSTEVSVGEGTDPVIRIQTERVDSDSVLKAATSELEH
ncbi:MAG: 2Fe-2S iron-sulfur cluster-binding protein, partial [Spirochaetota bacterium]